MMIDFTVGGPAVPQPRQRHGVIDGKVMNFTPRKDPVQGYKAAVNLAARLARPRDWPLDAAYRVLIVVVVPRPQRLGKRPGAVLSNTKPDADNYLKAILDALKSQLLNDDGQAADVRVVKVYAAAGLPPAARIVIEAIAPTAAVVDLDALVSGWKGATVEVLNRG